MPARLRPIPVYLEVGRKRAFACTLDWPGWSRAGKDEALALAALAAAAGRYAAVVTRAGLALPAGAGDAFDVVERLPGSAGTEFGVPSEVPAADDRPLTAREADRLARLLEACWAAFDEVVAHAPAELRKGPRGGGRDRDAIVNHVLGAEEAYARKLGLRLRQPPAADTAGVAAFRQALGDAIRQARSAAPVAPKGWPARYAARRLGWHVADHAWEIEDRSDR